MTTPAILRKIASRGRLDDMDVQEVFDAADEIEALALALAEETARCQRLETALGKVRGLSNVIGDSQDSRIYIEYLDDIFSTVSEVLHD